MLDSRAIGTTFVSHGAYGEGFTIAQATETDARLFLAGMLIRNKAAIWGPVHLAANGLWVAHGFIPAPAA